FAAMLPVSGSAYSYSYATLGELVAWFIGWNLVLEYLFAASTVAVGWSGYLNGLLQTIGNSLGRALAVPGALAAAPLAAVNARFPVTGSLANLPALLSVVAVAALCYRGITQTAFVNTLIGPMRVTVILLFIALGLQYVGTANWQP